MRTKKSQPGWTPEQDEKLKQLVEEHSGGSRPVTKEEMWQLVVADLQSELQSAKQRYELITAPPVILPFSFPAVEDEETMRTLLKA